MKGINTPDTTAIDINLKGVSPLPVSRGIAAKRAIERDYLERLNEVYSEFFLYYDDAPLLIANASSIRPTAMRTIFTWWTTCWKFTTAATTSTPLFSGSISAPCKYN